MKKEWKKLFKRISVLALAITMLFETVVGNTLAVKAAPDGNHVYVETYLDGVLEKTQDLGVKTGWVDIQLPYRAHYSMSQIWVDDVKQPGTGYCGFSMPANDVTVKLCYIADKHTISFFDLDGNSATEAPVNVNYNQKLKANQVPDALRDGTIITSWELTGGAYTEFGWVLNQTYTKEQILSMKVGSDMTFKAVGKSSSDAEFTVTFMDDDKTTKLAEVQTEKRTATYPNATPTKASEDKDGFTYSYTFAGWVDAEGNPAVLSGLTADKTVYASYTETKTEIIPEVQEYTVIANAVDGTFKDGTNKKTYAGITVGKKPNLETPNGAVVVENGIQTEYKFKDWTFTDKDGNVVDPTKAKNGDVVYATANYEVKSVTTLKYKLMVDEQQADGTNDSNANLYWVQVSTVQELTNPTKADAIKDGVKTEYTFTGWKYTYKGSEISVEDLVKVGDKEEVVATAQYDETTTTLYYNVIFKNEGNEVDRQQVQVSKTPDETKVASVSKTTVVDNVNGTKTEYTFAGWKYVDANGNAVVPAETAADATIYAIATYTEQTTDIFYNVTVKDDDGNVVDSKEVQVGQNPNLPAPEKESVTEDGETKDYIFKEWEYTTEDGTTVDPSKVPEGTNVIATPKFEEKTQVYTVHYDALEGAFSNGDKTFDKEVAVGNAPAGVEEPKRATTTDMDGVKTEYEFIGWTYKDSAGKVITDLTTVPKDAKITAEAVYASKELSYKVIVQYQNGTIDNEYVVAVGKDFVPPITPEKADETDAVTGFVTTYEFAGWQYVNANGSVLLPKDAQAGDVVYAKADYTATVQKYTVTYKTHDSSETVEVAVGKEPEKVNDPDSYESTDKFEGFVTIYTFEKWVYTDEAGKEVTDFTQVKAGEQITATAKYTGEEQAYQLYIDYQNGTPVVGPNKAKVGNEINLGTPKKEAAEENGVRTEYTFKEWKIVDTEGTEYEALSQVPAGKEVTATAIYDETKIDLFYTVKVDEANGKAEYNKEVKVGTTVDLGTPTKAPTEEGTVRTYYDFDKWVYTDAEGNVITDLTKVGKDEVVNATATYTTTTEDITYTVIVDGDEENPVEVPVGTTPDLEEPTKSSDEKEDGSGKIDYEFGGWEYTDKDGNPVDPKEVSEGEVINADPIWNETEVDYFYNIKVDEANGKAEYDKEVKVGTTVDLGTPTKAPTEEGAVRTYYDFDKWVYTDAEGNVITDLTKVGKDEVVKATATYTTRTEDITYTVIVDGDEEKPVEVPVGSTPDLEEPTKPSDEKEDGSGKIDYEFGGWEYTDKDGNPVDPKEVSEGEEIYADPIWKETVVDYYYNVEVDEANGKETYGVKVKVGTTTDLGTPTKDATVEGNKRTTYTFEKWVYTNAAGEEITDLTKVKKDENVKAVAKYTAKTEDITYTVIVDGDKENPIEVPIGTIPDIDEPTKEPDVREDGTGETEYEFGGWEYTDKDGNPVDPEKVPEGEEIYADPIWKETEVDYTYTVKIDEANGKVVYDETVKVGTTPELGTPVKEATVEGNQKTTYAFDKWVYTDKDGNEVDPKTVGKDEVITATAKYTSKTETVTTPVTPGPNPTPNPDPIPEPVPEPQEVNEPEPVPPVITPIPPTVVEEDDEEEPIVIEDEEPALDDGNGDAKEVVAIDDEDVALAAEVEDDGNCFVHWIILILSVAYVIFAGVRIADRKKKIDELEDEQNQQEAQA